jgi:hypothetical protein
MAEPDTNSYIAVMAEVKRRIAVVDSFLNGKSTALYRETGIECMILQLRMTMELIALGSLAANKELFEQQKKKFEKHWNPADILRDIEALNPHFYPRPVQQVPANEPGIKTNLVDIKSGFLTQADLIEIHGRCGNLLHANNPYRKGRDYDLYERFLPTWRKKVVSPLNSHVIRLLSADRMYLVQMGRDGKPTVTIFEGLGVNNRG